MSNATRIIGGRKVTPVRCEGIGGTEALDRLDDRYQYAPEMDVADLAEDIAMEAHFEGIDLWFRVEEA